VTIVIMLLYFTLFCIEINIYRTLSDSLPADLRLESETAVFKCKLKS